MPTYSQPARAEVRLTKVEQLIDLACNFPKLALGRRVSGAARYESSCEPGGIRWYRKVDVAEDKNATVSEA